MLEEIKPIEEAERDVPFQGSAILTNRFYITLGPSGVRIAFAEQGIEAKPPIFRSAVIMSFQDGIELAKLLKGMLKNIEDSIAQEMAALKEKPPSENAEKPGN